MTDKQIIIDGVDVLKEKINMCFILLSHKLETSETIEQTIYDHLDVFVKEWNNQLKRKEQECEELKDKLNCCFCNPFVESNDIEKLRKCVEETECFRRKLDQLKAENEKLKKQVCGLRPELKYIIDKTCSKYNINAKYYHEKIVEIINNLDKYKQTLIEIKEIAKNVQSFVGRINIEDDVFEQMEQILQKISEVIK